MRLVLRRFKESAAIGYWFVSISTNTIYPCRGRRLSEGPRSAARRTPTLNNEHCLPGPSRPRTPATWVAERQRSRAEAVQVSSCDS